MLNDKLREEMAGLLAMSEGQCDPLNIAHLLVLDFIARHPGANAAEIARHFGWNYATTRDRVLVLSSGVRSRPALGLVKTEKSGGHTRYSITEEGKRLLERLS